MSYAAGTIVKARGREWVVLPAGSDPKIITLKPLGGSDFEIAGILPSLESVESASFAPPDPADLGDWTSARLLREAARLSTRNAAGAIRCWSRIDAEPRPYQLVPLLMALKMDTVRLLIADDVGIGKTIESLLIARELWDRGVIDRIAVLAPPALVDQWVSEMGSKFHLEAVPVLAGTAARLERGLPAGRSLFEEYPITVVSLDFIKAEKRRAEFLRTCPEFVIVDEAHSSAAGMGVKHQRFHLLQSLAEDQERHMLLVTATPHSGNTEAFGSLVGLLATEIAQAVASGSDIKELLAPHFVQRRRPDIRSYLETTTTFPKRESKEAKYYFSDKYTEFYRRVLDYIQGSLKESEAGSVQHRVRWWSALALLRAISSSPLAAAATLRTRSGSADAENASEADEIGKRLVLDQDAIDGAEGMDAVPGSADEGDEATQSIRQRKLRELAKMADSIEAKDDTKLQLLIKEVKELLAAKYSPIVFCRFIATAEYVAEQLRLALEKDREWKGKTGLVCVTGVLAPEDRRARIEELSEENIGERMPILVATDCLSEGVNLQDRFTAVLHYDLAWNPTRHEQREGRVDRFGQRASTVRALTIYGANNPVDGIVLDILINKHIRIVKDLGVSIPVPMDSNEVLAAIMEGMDFRSSWKQADGHQVEFDFGQDLLLRKKKLHADWDDAAKRDTESRTKFAQRSIDSKDVAHELEELRAASGDHEALRWFMEQSLKRLEAVVTPAPHALKVNPQTLPAWFREQVGLKKTIQFGFDDLAPKGATILTRSHPIVAALSSQVLESALDSSGRQGASIASRAGVIKTTAVSTRTVLLLVRFRYDLAMGRGKNRKLDLAEDVGAIAFRTGAHASPETLSGAEAEALFGAQASGNVAPDLAKEAIVKEIERLPERKPALAAEGRRRAVAYAASFARLRESADLKGGTTSVEPRGEPDILGIYVYLPGAAK
ncbi:MAG: SNF2-related protein [Spirochaetota bacterium]